MTPSKPPKPAAKRRRHQPGETAAAAAPSAKPSRAAAARLRKGTSGSKSPGSRGESALARGRSGPPALVDQLAGVPEEEVWLAGLRSERTRRAYRLDVRDFMQELAIAERDELYRVMPAAVLAWRRSLEERGVKASTIRRKLSALSSLYRHLVAQHLAEFNPVRDITRPRINRTKGSTAAFSREQARAILDAPPKDTVPGLRDRALLSVGLQAGPRRAEIAHLTVGDLQQHRGLPRLRVLRKGGEDGAIIINSQTELRIREYLEAAGHADDFDGPLFRPTRANHVPGTDDMRRHMAPDMVDKIVRKWCHKALEASHGFSAHSMRATFITRALENGCPKDRVQKDVGHKDASTTDLYDHRGDNDEEAAAFFATY